MIELHLRAFVYSCQNVCWIKRLFKVVYKTYFIGLMMANTFFIISYKKKTFSKTSKVGKKLQINFSCSKVKRWSASQRERETKTGRGKGKKRERQYIFKKVNVKERRGGERAR